MILNNLLIFVVLTQFYSCWTQEEQLKAIVSYKSCKLDTDCFENSFCYGNDNTERGQCKCNEGYDMLLRNKTYYACLKSLGYQEKCSYKEECLINLGSRGDCQGNVCTCALGSHLYDLDQRCYETVLLLKVCKSKANCKLTSGGYASCYDGMCQCDPGQIPTATFNDCIVSKKLGETCQDDLDCTRISNSYCGNVCRCREGYSVNSLEIFCLKDVTEFGGSCQEDVQCAKFLPKSICSTVHKNCTCPTDYHISGNECIQSIKLGETCELNDECVYKDGLQNLVECRDTVCSCKVGKTGYECTEDSGANIFKLNLFLIVCVYVASLIY